MYTCMAIIIHARTYRVEGGTHIEPKVTWVSIGTNRSHGDPFINMFNPSPNPSPHLSILLLYIYTSTCSIARFIRFCYSVRGLQSLRSLLSHAQVEIKASSREVSRVRRETPRECMKAREISRSFAYSSETGNLSEFRRTYAISRDLLRVCQGRNSSY